MSQRALVKTCFLRFGSLAKFEQQTVCCELPILQFCEDPSLLFPLIHTQMQVETRGWKVRKWSGLWAIFDRRELCWPWKSGIKSVLMWKTICTRVSVTNVCLIMLRDDCTAVESNGHLFPTLAGLSPGSVFAVCVPLLVVLGCVFPPELFTSSWTHTGSHCLTGWLKPLKATPLQWNKWGLWIAVPD